MISYISKVSCDISRFIKECSCVLLCSMTICVAVRRGVLLGLIFAGYVPLAFQNPYPIIVYSVAIL